MNDLNSLITVGLTVADAVKFKQFCQYYNQISYLLEAEVFERVKPGSFVVHIGKDGELGKLELHLIVSK